MTEHPRVRALGTLLLLAAGTGPQVVLVPEPAPRVVVPGGRFTMGATTDEVRAAELACTRELRAEGALSATATPRCRGRFDNELPAAEVVLPAFAIDRREVTRGEYAGCVRDGACTAVPGGSEQGASLPIDRVTFADAVAFCRHRGGRLPTEAEWERAARGSRSPWPWGRAFGPGHSNGGRARSDAMLEGDAPDGDEDARDGFEGLAPVGSFRDGASPFGLHDVAGNVWEWTSGFFAREPPQVDTRFDPHGPAVGEERTIRGGSYLSPPTDQRVTRRVGLAPSERRPGVGFRCAYDVP